MNWRIEKTINTPGVIIEPGRIDIRGKSIPEDAFAFFLPLIDRLTTYFQEDYPATSVIIYFEFVNSASKKFVKSIFQMLEKAYALKPVLMVRWQFDEDDESVYDLGQYLQAMYKLPVKIEEVL